MYTTKVALQPQVKIGDRLSRERSDLSVFQPPCHVVSSAILVASLVVWDGSKARLQWRARDRDVPLKHGTMCCLSISPSHLDVRPKRPSRLEPVRISRRPDSVQARVHCS